MIRFLLALLLPFFLVSPLWANTVVLKPSMTTKALVDEKRTVPQELIRSLGNRSLVFDSLVSLDQAPYVLAIHNNQVTAAMPGTVLFARGVMDAKVSEYDVYRPEAPFRDLQRKTILGYPALYVGRIKVNHLSDPAECEVIRAEQTIQVGDRLFPAKPENNTENLPLSEAPEGFQGTILAVLGGVTQIGQYHVVVVDRGNLDGLKPGTRLSIYVQEPSVQESSRFTLKKPSGTLILYQVFRQVSFGIVVSATGILHVGDKVKNK